MGLMSNICVIDRLGDNPGWLGSLSSICRKRLPGELRGAGAGLSSPPLEPCFCQGELILQINYASI